MIWIGVQKWIMSGCNDLTAKGGKFMKDNLKPEDKSQGSEKIKTAPEYITCPKCGGGIELW